MIHKKMVNAENKETNLFILIDKTKVYFLHKNF